MKCRDCPEGRAFAEGSVFCIPYGMIIRGEHECTLRAWEDTEDDGTDGQRQRGDDETGLQKDGRRTAETLPGVLSESGK